LSAKHHLTGICFVVAVVVASLGIVACGGGSVDAPLPSDAEQFSPPAVYTTWWNMTRACSGLDGSLGAVTWYKTTAQQFDPRTGEPVVGRWTPGSNRIVMSADAVLLGGSVRHEMLHALLNKSGHPRSEFLGDCGGTVDCLQACILDAGAYPQPPQAPVHVRADAMEISLDIEPRNPTTAQDGGFFTITVIAHNPSSSWATVAPVSAATDTTRTFSTLVTGTEGRTDAVTAIDPSQRVFAPGESKRLVFDYRMGDDAFSRQLPPGSYTVRGAYSDFWTGDSTFVIGP
jgi:hypothetical protein